MVCRRKRYDWLCWGCSCGGWDGRVGGLGGCEFVVIGWVGRGLGVACGGWRGVGSKVGRGVFGAPSLCGRGGRVGWWFFRYLGRELIKVLLLLDALTMCQRVKSILRVYLNTAPV